MAKLAADLDGMTIGGLASKGRYGDTMIAHINPQEAQMLMNQGGAGTINPMTGLPEFYDGDEGGFGDGGYAGSGDFGDDDFGESTADIGGFDDGPSGSAMDAVDAEAYAQAAIEDPDIPVSADDIADFYGFGSPTAGVAGAQEGFKDFGGFLGGEDALAEAGITIDPRDGRPIFPSELQPYLTPLIEQHGSLKAEQMLMDLIQGTPGLGTGLTTAFDSGYRYGGPMPTLIDLVEQGRTDILESAAAEARKKKEIEDDTYGESTPEIPTYEEPGVMDRFASILGLDDFSLDSLNPFSTTLTPAQQAIMQSYRDQGLTVQKRSDMDNLIGLGIGAALPIQLSGPKFLAEKATNTGIFALATDPVTGLEYLVDNSGGLQLAPGQLEETSYQDGGNEPAITKKRKVATQPVKEKDVTKDVNKPSFPQQSLPRFTKGSIENLKISLKDDPEKLAQILQNYSIPDEYSGLRTLV